MWVHKELIMNDKNPTREQDLTPQPIPENLVTANELSPPPREELLQAEHPHEKEIDLNKWFPDAETNLNTLFPDIEMKHLLQSITKNKKDMSAIKERLTIENETFDENKDEELTDDSSSSDKAEDIKTD